jgi:Raf kinase inhibitor-like YbhB/YbcL family protein
LLITNLSVLNLRILRSAFIKPASSIPFEFTSNSFVSGEPIPIKHSCGGTEVSPQLQWTIDSPEIKSFVLIMEDYDAIKIIDRPYVHWNVYKIPADTRVIAEGATNMAMPAGSIEGVNDDGLARYSGPCPPEGTGTHHYFFTLYALNKDNLSIDTTKAMLRSTFEAQFKDSIIQKAEISGSYIYK